MLASPPTLAADLELLRTVAAAAGADKAFGEGSAALLDPDGTLYLTDLDRGVVHVFGADSARAEGVIGKDKAFRSKKLTGIARLDKTGIALANAGDDRIAALDDLKTTRIVIANDGSREGQVSSPAALAASTNGRLYVADRGNRRISVFARDGLFLFAFGHSGPEAERLTRPVQVAVDGQERVFVLDERDGGVVGMYAESGALLKRFPSSQFKNASERAPALVALAADGAGHVFVADKANGKILELDPDSGKIVFAFGSRGTGRGQFDDITAIAVAADRKLAVVDTGNRKVEIYRLPGAAVAASERARLPLAQSGGVLPGIAKALGCERAYAFPQGGALCVARGKRAVLRVRADGRSEPFAGPFDSPLFAAVDERDVAVIDGDRVKVFGHDGKLRFTFGEAGSGDSQLDSPQGVLLADRIYVADTGNRRVQMFSRDGVFLEKFAPLSDAKEPKELLRKPGALAMDSLGNLYVADNNDGVTRVFAPAAAGARKFLYELGERAGSPQHFNRIEGVVVDRDDNVYVLGSTETNAATVRVFAGPRQMLAFGAEGETGFGIKEPTSLSLVREGKPAVAVYDRGRGVVQRLHYMQVPAQVGGLVVVGGPQQTTLKWQKVPGGFVERYQVYAATEAAGPFEPAAQTKQNSAVTTHTAEKRYRYFRIAAVSAHGVEGLASPARPDLFQEGYVHFGEKRYPQAAENFTQALREAPINGHAREYLGRALLEQGKYDDALAHFQDLEKLVGFETTAFNLQVDAFLRARQFARARGLIDRARSERRSDAQTALLCGRLLLQMNDPLGASECLEQALRLGRDTDEVHLLLGQAYVKLNVTQKAIAEFDKAARIAPDNAAGWAQSGLAFQTLGLHKEASERFEKALALDPVNAAARLGAARSLVALQQYDQAQSVAAALVGNPEQEAAGYYLLGVVAQARQEPQEALINFRRATSKDARQVAAWLALADVQAQLKDEAGVVEALRAAVKADPDNADTRQRLALQLQKAGDHAGAVEHFARAVELTPNQLALRQAYTTSLLALDRLKDAAVQAAEAARLAPNDVEPLLRVAEIAQRQGKHGDAIGFLARALKLKPNSADVNLRLGAVYAETSAYEQAQPLLEKAALLEPHSARPHELLGEMFLERRLFDAAITALGKAAQLNPSAENTLHLNTAYAEKKKAAEFKGNAPRVLLQDLSLKRVFSAAYKQYAGDPVGSVKLANVSPSDYKNLKLSFHIKGYMDFPVTTEIALLKGQETQQLPLIAAFNNKILALDEDTGVQVEVKVSFFHEGREASVELTRPMTIYGKNAILWREFAMVGAFITPKDETLKNFVRAAVNQYAGEDTGLNRNLILAMTLFDVLSAHGTRYLADPNSPYSKLTAEQVDYVQFPRETLRLKNGDCDDLSVLYAAMLENVGIETAFVDVPGHLFMMFNTGLSLRDAEQISVQEDLLVLRDGQVWLPVEATMVATSFSEAWSEGARKYRDYDRAGKLKVLVTKSAWERFIPVTLAPADFAVEVPAGDRVKLKLERERTVLVTRSLDRAVRPYRAMLQVNARDAEARMQVAIVYARAGLYDLALRELDQLLEADATSAGAHNNRGNIYYIQGEYERALEAYRYAGQLDPTDGGIRVNLALSYYRLGRVREATESFGEAVRLNRAIETQYQSLRKLLGV